MAGTIEHDVEMHINAALKTDDEPHLQADDAMAPQSNDSNSTNNQSRRFQLATFDNPVFDRSDVIRNENPSEKLPKYGPDIEAADTSESSDNKTCSDAISRPEEKRRDFVSDGIVNESDSTDSQQNMGNSIARKKEGAAKMDGGKLITDGVVNNIQTDAMTNNSNDPKALVNSNDTKVVELPLEKDQHLEVATGPERETWGKKMDFLLSVIGFAVDLGNVWRFPYICYRNGGGAFLVPYGIMLIFGGLPLFYMELALGQFQRCGCISVWSRICPMFKGIGFGICFIAMYVSFYYNTVIAWALYFMFASMRAEVPWLRCGHVWNTENCTEFFNRTNATSTNYTKSPASEFFQRSVLELQSSSGIDDVGPVKWSIALCLLAVFIIVYFSLWKGIKSSGKAVWITATAPYIILLILLVRGVTLPGALEGIIYYLKPQWHRLLKIQVWNDAASQIFFSLGPGFGVLLALSSYNKFHNDCYKDALITSMINCFTSFLSGFVVFSVLGYMAYSQHKTVESVAEDGPGLVFVAYPEAIATLNLSSFWAIIFFLMLITLGLDSTFGGLEAMITGICDEWPALGKRREIFVAGLIATCFLGGLSTTTYGGYYLFVLLDHHGVPISILFIVFIEAIALNWFYGVNRFSDDVQMMLGYRPGIFWRICWAGICPIFCLVLFILACTDYNGIYYPDYTYPDWAVCIGWIITCSSLFCIPLYIVYKYIVTPGTIVERLKKITRPEVHPKFDEKDQLPLHPVYL